jgi:ketosteroid isomerase-like protein
MRFFHASLFALCLLTVAPAGSVAADVKSDVTAAYAAWDAAFNKGDAKAVSAAYLPSAKADAANPRGGFGLGGDREVFRGATRQRCN